MEPAMLLLTIVALCIGLYYFLFYKMAHFERLRVPHLTPVPILGNLASPLFRRMSMVDYIRHVYNSFPDAKYVGFYDFMTPVYLLRDPELINSVAIKNFDYFCDHVDFVNVKLNPIAGKNLFQMKGDYWRELRKVLSPSFTSSKMKMMFHLMQECAENFSNFLTVESKDGKEYELKDILNRYTTDVVASCAFGIKLDSVKNPKNEFMMLAKTLTFNSKMFLKFVMNRNFPLLSKLLGIRMFSHKVENFFKAVVNDTVKLRKQKGIVRPDMIQLMLENFDKDNKQINIDEMTAQAFVFFIAGYDSVSASMCFLIHEIGVNPDVQSRLQEEIDDVIKQTNGKPTYEAINRMKYLDAVINESLRLYSIAIALDRVCVKNFELPPATPGGKAITVRPGDIIWIPSYALHLDPKYFPDPQKFDPNRFLESNLNNSLFMPFGIGPRICIAYRFALLETKVMLFHLLARCNLEPASKTKIPMVLSKEFALAPEGGFWMKLRKRSSTAFVTE